MMAAMASSDYGSREVTIERPSGQHLSRLGVAVLIGTLAGVTVATMPLHFLSAPTSLSASPSSTSQVRSVAIGSAPRGYSYSLNHQGAHHLDTTKRYAIPREDESLIANRTPQGHHILQTPIEVPIPSLR